MTWAVGVFWIILKQQVSCFFYSRFRSKGLSLGGLKNCTNFKISFRIFRRLSTGTFDLEKRVITSLLHMITRRMNWYIKRFWLWEKYLSVQCLMVLFIIVIVRQTIPLHQGIASYYQIYQVPDMQPIIWAGFKIVNQSNNQEPAVFVEGKGSVLHHGVGTVRVDYQHHDQCQQPLRSHQGNLWKRGEEWWERISSKDCYVGCTWCPAVVPKLAEAKNWLNPAKGRVENRLQLPPKPSSLYYSPL